MLADKKDKEDGLERIIQKHAVGFRHYIPALILDIFFYSILRKEYRKEFYRIFLIGLIVTFIITVGLFLLVLIWNDFDYIKAFNL